MSKGPLASVTSPPSGITATTARSVTNTLVTSADGAPTRRTLS
jgi:hypothetical protein